MTFWERFESECKLIGMKPNRVGKEAGISSGTITNWRNGKEPSTVSLEKLSDYLKVSADYLLGRTDVRTTRGNDLSGAFTAAELEIIQCYRQLAAEGQRYVNTSIALSLLEYSVRRKNPKLESFKIESNVAAGPSRSMGDQDHGDRVELTSIPQSANSIVRVVGDSMYPLLNDGQTVFVRRQNDIENGEIGVFKLDGDKDVCKRAHKDKNGNIVELRSVNPDYAPITSWDTLSVIGKVVFD